MNKDEILREIASDLRQYRPESDEYKGQYIHKGWADRIEAALAQPVQPTALGSLAERRIFDAIRSAYDMGYADARNIRTVPGDSAPGYKGREIEADHGGALLRSLNTTIAQPAQPAALRGTDAQILIEREITANAIQGAMAYGYQNGEYPPDDAEWLRPFWEIGRRDAERKELISAQPVQPPSWDEAQRVCDLPAVDEAIRNLIEDNTGDNATCLVREIMNIAQPVQPADHSWKTTVTEVELDDFRCAARRYGSHKAIELLLASKAQPVERKPLTEDERDLICEKALFCRISFQQFGRAIEAAHDIKAATV